MNILTLLRRESELSLGSIVSLASIAGLSNALILTILNGAIDSLAHASSLPYLLLFTIAIVIYVVTKRRLMVMAIHEIEQSLHRIRTRLAGKAEDADLLPIERIGRAEIYAVVNRETLTISQAGRPLVQAFQAVMLFGFALLYIAWLSAAAFLLFVGLISAGLWFYMQKRQALAAELHEALNEQNRLFEALTHLLDGFKEIKLHAPRRGDLRQVVQRRSASARELTASVETQFADLSTFSQAGLYVGIGGLVFLLPQLAGESMGVVVKVTTAALFIMGPVYNVIGTLPDLSNANVAAENVYAMEARLDRAIQKPAVAAPPLAGFGELRLEGVAFRFGAEGGAAAFTVGPLDFTLRAGETVFITGGNGSGKSTFLKVLAALYYPNEGRLRVDGREVDAESREAYRGLFSAVFADYHLFDRLYGLTTAEPQRIEELLAEMELTGKTRLADDAFTSLRLSTGQRKRLALAVAILEQRPILVLDEWAADQDVVFRRKFYDEILPRLRQQGRTVVAVTHDERYFGRADRKLRMEDGRLTALDAGGNHDG